MKENILIVEDEFIVANDLSLMLTKAGYSVCGIAASVKQAMGLIQKNKPTWVLLDIFLQDGSKGTELADYLTAQNIGFIYISANTNQSILESAKATQPYGFLVKPFREKDLWMMLEIATERHRENLQFRSQREQLLENQLNHIVNHVNDKSKKIAAIPGAFQALIPFDFLKISYPSEFNSGLDELNFIRTGFNEYQILNNAELFETMNLAAKETNKVRSKTSEDIKTALYNNHEFRRLLMDDPAEKQLGNFYKLESKITFPLMITRADQALFSFYGRKPQGYSWMHLNMLTKSKASLQLLLQQIHQDNTNQVFDEIRKGATETPAPAKTDIEPAKFDGIVGTSKSLLEVLDNVDMISKSDISVLILGESGTGKERVAQCIHKLSARKNKPIITVNCAALPSELIESELFGHEKGAFTGALEKRTGKFELADGGTLFLDEIGELPLEAQVKLLRVLQEREVEHVGGSKMIKVDVRIIAATNKRLEKEVAEGRFRLDLYYRLNVLPIELPPLRERKDDIPLLVDHFLSHFAKQMNKALPELSKEALKQLISYSWPGNIRELGHLLERSVLLAKGKVITSVNLPAPMTNQKSTAGDLSQPLKTLEEMEVEHILNVLKKCNGKVCGVGGAAEVLGLPPSTLNSKIKKLGIKRESYFNV
ncbi:MAG TPA: sigma 54-interacting response regulator [Mucilaginibacter sp.]|jgi:DNA-binding NtrC family response regulator